MRKSKLFALLFLATAMLPFVWKYAMAALSTDMQFTAGLDVPNNRVATVPTNSVAALPNPTLQPVNSITAKAYRYDIYPGGPDSPGANPETLTYLGRTGNKLTFASRTNPQFWNPGHNNHLKFNWPGTSTHTPTSTITMTPTNTYTFTPTRTFTNTPTNTHTFTPTPNEIICVGPAYPGLTGGWAFGDFSAGDEGTLLGKLNAGSTDATALFYVNGLKVGDVVTGFYFNATAIDLDTGSIILTAELRKVTAGGNGAVGLGTSVPVTQTTMFGAFNKANTLKILDTPETIAANESLFVLMTGTTVDFDGRLHSIGIVRQ